MRVLSIQTLQSELQCHLDAINIQLNLKEIGIMDILCAEQHVFSKGHSTVTIVKFYLQKHGSWPINLCSAFRSKKAFDTVDVETVKIIFKLKRLGINNTEQAWFLNFLIYRVQCVSFSGATSSECCMAQLACPLWVHPESPSFCHLHK